MDHNISRYLHHRCFVWRNFDLANDCKHRLGSLCDLSDHLGCYILILGAMMRGLFSPSTVRDRIYQLLIISEKMTGYFYLKSFWKPKKIFLGFLNYYIYIKDSDTVGYRGGCNILMCNSEGVSKDRY